MAFEVLITDQAFDNLDAITDFIKKNSSMERARRWFASMVQAIETLKEMPRRCPRNRRSWGRRSVFCSTVAGIEHTRSTSRFHIRHWARQRLTAGQIRELVRQFEEDELIP